MRHPFFLPLLCAASLGCLSPIAHAEEPAAAVETGAVPVPLIPILQTVLNGAVRWHPAWPLDFPPDAFSAAVDGALTIRLSSGSETVTFRRDSAGRIREFPHFSAGGVFQVRIDYSPAGEMSGMTVSGAGDAEAESAAVWEIVFPPGFFTEGDIAPGRVLPPVRVSSGGVYYFVALFGSPVFLSETWFDSAGTMAAYYSAAVSRNEKSWRIRSVRSWDSGGQTDTAYFFDASGNTSAINAPAGTYSALYRGRRPVYWERPVLPAETPAEGSAAAETPAATAAETPAGAAVSRFSLQWDERGFLVGMQTEGADAAQGEAAEYRYEYEEDAAGNWTRRQDIALVKRFGVFAPVPGRTWTRSISVTEE
jgi:hypothetical protein